MKKVLVVMLSVVLFGCGSLRSSSCGIVEKCHSNIECCEMDHCDKGECVGNCCEVSCCGK